MYQLPFIAMIVRSTIRRTYAGVATQWSTAGLYDMRSCSHHPDVLANVPLELGLATRHRSEIPSEQDVCVCNQL